MMRSLFSGVSGLKSHQTRMDTIGNNIANVNTTGFKSSRTTFADTLSQTLSGASAPGELTGGTNAKQVGLGTGVASIDTIFTDGSVQSTGKNTDLCLSGNGLFVVQGNGQTYYTRDGAFEFDAAGNYVLPSSGLYVQGWMVGTDGKLSSALTNITIPAGKGMSAAATGTATYSNNLDASVTGYDISNIVVNYTDGTSETVTDYNPTKTLPGTIKLTLSSGETVILDSTAGYSFTTGNAVTNKVLYTSTIKSLTASTSGKVDLTCGMGTGVNSIDGNTSFSATDLTSGTYSVDGKYVFSGTIKEVTANGTGTGEVTLKVDVNGTERTVKVPEPQNFTYAVGDTFSASLPVTKMTGHTGASIETVAGTSKLTGDQTVSSTTDTYVRKVTADDGTVTGVSRTGSTAYTYNGKTVSSCSITASDGTSLTGLVSQKYAANDTFYSSTTTSINVYDSLGNSLTVPVLFTKTASNTWSLSLAGGTDSTTIKDSAGKEMTISLTATDLKFDSSGKYVSGSASLESLPVNGSKSPQNITLNLGSLTQYAGSSTINASADGNAAGTLSSISIDSTGTITGTYTNGKKQTEAQVAVAQFNNASGLTKTGNSLYQASNNSGTANVKTASALGVTITPSALEMSNVDIANEFSDMIITQRGFQSNSKIITVGDEMLETLIGMKR